MKQLPAIDITVDTFYSWIVKCNSLITLANTEIVTANNSANGAITTGTGYVIGTFGANTIVCSTLQGGNTVTSGPITIVSNTSFANGVIVSASDGIYIGNTSSVHVSSSVLSTSNTSSNQVVDTFRITSFRTAKYLISITDPTNGNYQATEIMLLQDGNTSYTTEYATLLSNTTLATFSSDVNVSNNGLVRLLVTPSIPNVQINVSKTIIAI